MEDIVRGAIGLVTEGFLRRGRRRQHRRPPGTGPSPASSPAAAALGAELSDGTTLPARSRGSAPPGFTQGVPFLPEDVRDRCWTSAGTSCSSAKILPIDVPGLYFNGYNSSFFSPLNAELAAVWIAADLAGAGTPARRTGPCVGPSVDQLAFMDTATDTHHCRCHEDHSVLAAQRR